MSEKQPPVAVATGDPDRHDAAHRAFADQAVVPVVRDRWAQAGWIGVIAFNALLVLFGWGFLLWSAPAVGVLTVLAVKDWPRLSDRGPS